MYPDRSFWQLRRRNPLLTVVVDTPERTRGWFEIVDRLTDETGLVTSEVVPAFRATGPNAQPGARLDCRGLPGTGDATGCLNYATLVDTRRSRTGADFVDIKHCHGYLGHEFLNRLKKTKGVPKSLVATFTDDLKKIIH